ncbi:dynactin subunit 4 [Anabrus simplex]|uniref:dynactin subunit 4 n=1 Tax=Anabrus simplex TaxID=316456 RepID=UPI0035A38C90
MIMAYILQPDIVRYACSCGSLKPISRIYFCRHCLKIRCGYCVCHEVDSHYCANCLENLPSAEARLKKQRCANCFDCPSCLHTLSTRANTIVVSSSEEKPVPRKVYYMACGFCRWTSRDVGLPDQTVASGGLPEKENPSTARINSLLEYYRALALKEKQEKERKKVVSRRSYLHFSDKFGLTAVMARKRAGLPQLGGGGLKDDLGNPPDVAPSVASEEVEQLPEEIFTTTINLTSVTTLTQRLAQPEFQPKYVSELYPAHKHLLIKRSQRCRSCEHNVSKPEYNPGSIKFKIQLSAYYHIPEVRMVTCEPLRIGEESHLIIKLCNPTQHPSVVQFLPLPTAEEDLEEQQKEMEEKRKQSERRDSDKDLSLTRQLSTIEDPRPIRVDLTGDILLPSSGVLLPPRDDAAEYDDSGDTHNYQDDPKVVVWRKANKAALKMVVIPSNEAREKGGEVVVGFLMNYTYMNTMATLEQKEPQKVNLKVKVFMTVGKVVGD